ncbi:MAG: hypothetical protein ACJAUN_000038 [Alcanivorax sp.]|jgi:hypothetical protein
MAQRSGIAQTLLLSVLAVSLISGLVIVLEGAFTQNA